MLDRCTASFWAALRCWFFDQPLAAIFPTTESDNFCEKHPILEGMREQLGLLIKQPHLFGA
ncbi:MAG TPA: hypothetical protein DEX10_10040 [Betaproteobacteria bacterium]|nr:hypothetical protein [Betaproteobacteria bacterium]